VDICVVATFSGGPMNLHIVLICITNASLAVVLDIILVKLCKVELSWR